MDEHDDTLRRLHELGSRPVDPAQSARDLTAMARVRAGRPAGGKLRLAGAFLAGLLIGSTGLAAADVLPDPAQHVAHRVLDNVGVQVPDPDRYHGPECGAEVKKNHGAYVRDDHALAQTDCGKKQKAVDAGRSGDDHGKADKADNAGKPAKGPCQGKPPWAGNKAMTAEEKAAAQAERAATCPADEPDATEDTAEVGGPDPSEPTQGSVDAGDGATSNDPEATTTTTG
jgi:hypothetical protein